MTEASDERSSDTYDLGRDFRAASRLDGQHCLWQETLGFHLHPTIFESLGPPEPELLGTTHVHPSSPIVTEVACGTAIWARQVAQRLPHAHVEACDISLAQCPPTSWLPQNLSLFQWDIFTDPPKSKCDGSDAVHARLLFSTIKDDEHAQLVIQQLAKLVKPGGWIQWDELDVASSFVKRVETTEARFSTPAIDKVAASMKYIGSWVNRLPRIMQECGLELAEISKFDEKAELARAFFDSHLAAHEQQAEVMHHRGDSESVEGGRRLLQETREVYEESKKGAVICTPKVVCIARKPVLVK